MNAPDNEPDYPDALIDRGLAELVGGETPPDLSDAFSPPRKPLHRNLSLLRKEPDHEHR